MSKIKIKSFAAAVIVAVGLSGFAGEADVPDYLWFQSVGGTVSVGFTPDDETDNPVLNYGEDVETVIAGSNGITKQGQFVIQSGQRRYIRISEARSAAGFSFKFGGAGKLIAGGDVAAVLDPNCAPASLGQGAYTRLFKGCTNLVSASLVLPATNLSWECCSEMFAGCTSLTNAPALPAEKLSSYCYANMFKDCVSLGVAPELPAVALTGGCYYRMFSGCSSLTSVKVSFADWNEGSNATADWLLDVAETGVFACPGALSTSDRDAGHIPEGWTVQKPAPADMPDYLSLAATGGDVTVKLDGTFPEVLVSLSAESLFYGSGMSLTGGTDEFTIPEGSTAYLRVKDACDVFGGRFMFYGEGMVAADGNVMSLLDPSCESMTVGAEAFRCLFEGCTILTDAPALPATNLAAGCYSAMFNGCMSLTNAPALPAMKLADSCYYGMFDGCSALKVAPDLMARELCPSCYGMMFNACSSLRAITVGFMDWCDDLGWELNELPTKGWCLDVADDGVFTCPSALPHDGTYINSADYIPWGGGSVVVSPDSEITDFKIIAVNVNESSVVITVQVTLAGDGDVVGSVKRALEAVVVGDLQDMASAAPMALSDDMVAEDPAYANAATICIPKPSDDAGQAAPRGFIALRQKE